MTTCQLVEDEDIKLKATHNFGGLLEDGVSGKANNLPPKGSTPRNTFESDVMDIRRINNSQIYNFNN